jgi:hypothetical protein
VTGEDQKRLEALSDEAFFTLVRRFLDSGGKQAPITARPPKERTRGPGATARRPGDRR